MSSNGSGNARIGLLCGITLSLALVSMPIGLAGVAGATGCGPPSQRILRSSTSCPASDQVAGSDGVVTIQFYSDPSIDDPGGITSGSDGALWFTNAGGGIGSITTGGSVSSYDGPGIDEPEGIAAGSDGALWFTNYVNSSIGRITTAGAVSNYANAGSQPQGITAGPDGALWYTNQLSNSIDRITTNGEVSDYGSFQAGIDDPVGITTGADGALWFTNSLNNSIGRITASGAITNYTDPSIDSPQEITAGSDGALWFTNYGNNSIGRITTAGVVTNYTDPTIDEPWGITGGPDGALWFTNAGTNSIGRITTSGLVSSFTAPGIDTSGYASEITTGPDGALWFGNNGNSIGQVVLKPKAPAISGTPPATPDGGVPYYFAFDVTGVPSATTTVISGALPPGLNLSSSGVITGTPTALGTYTATVTAANGRSPSASDTFTITVEPVPPSISGSPPTNVQAGVPYSYDFALGGFPLPTTEVTSGELPPGLALSSDGAITGTPTEAGTYQAEVTATNGYPPDATDDISITVDPALTISPSSGSPATDLTSNGAGFLPGEHVQVEYVDSGAQSDLCGSMVAADGTFTCSGDIPSGRNAGRDGPHKIISTGKTSGYEATAKFTLTNGVDQPTLVLSPSTDVLGGQTVAAWGSRWYDGSVPLYECSRNEPTIQTPYCHKLGTVHVGNGHWQISFPALIGQVGREPSSRCDAGEGSSPVCYVEMQQGDTTISAPISFRVLKLTINNKTGGSYHNGKLVTVRVANFPLHNRILVEMCPEINPGPCGYEVAGNTGTTGAIAFDDYSLNCVAIDESGVCFLLALDKSYKTGSGVATSISFSTYGLGGTSESPMPQLRENPVGHQLALAPLPER